MASNLIAMAFTCGASKGAQFQVSRSSWIGQNGAGLSLQDMLFSHHFCHQHGLATCAMLASNCADSISIFCKCLAKLFVLFSWLDFLTWFLLTLPLAFGCVFFVTSFPVTASKSGRAHAHFAVALWSRKRPADQATLIVYRKPLPR